MAKRHLQYAEEMLKDGGGERISLADAVDLFGVGSSSLTAFTERLDDAIACGSEEALQLAEELNSLVGLNLEIE